MAKNTLPGYKLNQIKQFRNEPVWSVVAPLTPGGSSNSYDHNLTYDQAIAKGFEISQGKDGRPWMRTQCNVVEIKFRGEFHSFA